MLVYSGKRETYGVVCGAASALKDGGMDESEAKIGPGKEVGDSVVALTVGVDRT